MKEFEPSTRWLKSVLPRKYADEINPNWCWPEIGEYYRTHDIPKEIAEPIAQAIIDSGNAWVCYKYCLHIEHREDMADVIKKSGNARICYWYCRGEDNREDLREIAKQKGYII